MHAKYASTLQKSMPVFNDFSTLDLVNLTLDLLDSTTSGSYKGVASAFASQSLSSFTANNQEGRRSCQHTSNP